MSEFPVLPREMLLVLNCWVTLYKDRSSPVLLLCSLIFKHHGPDFQLKWISMPLFEVSESTVIYTSWGLRSLVTAIRLLLRRSVFATLGYLLHWTLRFPAQFDSERWWILFVGLALRWTWYKDSGQTHFKKKWGRSPTPVIDFSWLRLHLGTAIADSSRVRCKKVLQDGALHKDNSV